MPLFHLSFDDNLPSYLKPRQPNGSENNDQSHFTHEDLPPRVSFAPSIEQCWYAIYPNIAKYFERFNYPYMDMYVYAYSSPHGQEHRIDEQVLKAKIHDWHITEEVCFIGTSVGIAKVGKIRIFNEEPNVEPVMYRPFENKNHSMRFLAPKMIYYVLENTHPKIKLHSTGYHLYHYSTQQLTKINTKRKQGISDPDLIRHAESRANNLGDIGCYLDHISFFLEPIPVDILPKLFKGKHPFYQPNATLIEHVVAVKLKDEIKWSLQETPVINEFSDRWDWEDIDVDKRRLYIRKINKEMTRLKLQGYDTLDMFNAIRPYIGRTKEYFIKARSSKWAEDTSTQYAAEVPHLMIYPKDGVMDVLKSKTVTLGLSSVNDISKKTFLSRFLK